MRLLHPLLDARLDNDFSNTESIWAQIYEEISKHQVFKCFQLFFSRHIYQSLDIYVYRKKYY